MRAEIAHGKAYGALAMGMGSRALFQRAQEQAVAAGEVFISLQRLQIDGTYTQGAADIGARGRFYQNTASGRIQVGTH